MTVVLFPATSLSAASGSSAGKYLPVFNFLLLLACVDGVTEG
jgi:hypothetical protein